MRIEEIIKEVKDILSEKRFYHSECVMKRAEELAEIYGADIEKAKICGILHDLAKEMKKTDLLEYALKNNIEVNEVEEKSPGLLHGKVAGHIAKNKYGIDDEMVEAISYHTTGKENMKLLTKIIYIADAVGEDRKYDNVPELYNLSKVSLDEACLLLMEWTIKEKIEEKKMIHESTIKARNYILKNK